ncbi:MULTISPECIES: response regulator transcription factor [unclassified Lebetimonas]|uniref:response regulator transcription factor n=1 Tax=unclassified Lebetimonas TaxID=2648158 RepID=UPI000462FCAC|nr:MULTISPECIES: response regulator transcription factor [unclassified Lebetimonas]
MIKIALIEDEEDLLDLLEFNLIKAGFDAVGFLNTKKVRDFIIEENPDLLIVDRNLPDIEGSEFVKNLKDEGFNIPVIFLTAKTAEEDVLEGFEKGADDYIKKPFSIKELIARIKAVLKRHNKKSNFLSYKNYKLDLINKNLLIDNETVDLTKSEFKLLKIFFENPKRVISKDEIAELLEINEKSVNVSINRLNHKIDLIESKRGIGYTLK